MKLFNQFRLAIFKTVSISLSLYCPMYRGDLMRSCVYNRIDPWKRLQKLKCKNYFDMNLNEIYLWQFFYFKETLQGPSVADFRPPQLRDLLHHLFLFIKNVCIVKRWYNFQSLHWSRTNFVTHLMNRSTWLRVDTPTFQICPRVFQNCTVVRRLL